ncbi:Protein GLUTAMINE DUMPER 4 [Orobanche gracilis]
MRTGADLFHSTPLVKTTAASAFSPHASVQRSQWRSPVPYLFGGLAAMLGLIAFALLILACSYWKLSGAGEDGGEGGADASERVDGGSDANDAAVFEEKILVIMAGDVEPSFLATPMPNKTWFSNNDDDDDDDDDDGEGKEIEKEENNRDEMSQENRHEDDESFPGSREQSN